MRVLLVVLSFAALAATFSGEAVAAPWCGTVSDVDRPAAIAGYPIRVLYATAIDSPDRADEFAARISGDMDEIAAWWQREDSSRTPRVDVAAFPCGPQVDLGRLKIPRSAAELVDPNTAWLAVRDVVRTYPIARYTKYLVYYDGPTGTSRICGNGTGVPNGFGLAVVYLGACAIGQTTAAIAVHELLHTMGALPGSGPPNACPDDDAHVCDSTGDVLYPHIQRAPISSLQLDVGRNDYYGHSGSWLDVQESLWLHRNDLSFDSTLTLLGSGRVLSDVPGIDCTASCRTVWSPGTLVTLTAEPAPGSRFVRWDGDCGGSFECELPMDAARAVTALFAPEKFRVAVSVAGRGRVTSSPFGISCPSRCAASFTSYEPIQLFARPAKGWRLSRWTGACRGRTTCILPLSRAAAAKATFVRVR